MSVVNISELMNLIWNVNDAIDVESIDDIHKAIRECISKTSLDIRYDRDYLMRRLKFNEDELHYDYVDGAMNVARKLFIIKMVTLAMLTGEAYDYEKEFSSTDEL